MRVDTLIMGIPRPSPLTLEKPFRTLEPLHLWIDGGLEALYPFNPWSLEPENTLHPLDPETYGFWERQTLWKAWLGWGGPLSLETLRPLDFWSP